MVEKGGKNIWDNSYDYSKVLINSSTHGDEKTPCWATMLAIKDVLNSNAPWAMFIKSSYIIRICPALNAWGFDNRNRANFNGQDINRDIIAQTQPESSVWKKWIDNNKDAIFYLDVHGVDYFHPFCEPYENDPYNKIYAQTMTKFASVFNANWDKYLGTKNKQATRPYTVISTYSGTTTEYTTQLGIPGFILETPCDIVNNQYNPEPNLFKNYSKSNKIAKDMIINFIIYFGQKFKKHEVPNLGKIELV